MTSRRRLLLITSLLALTLWLILSGAPSAVAQTPTITNLIAFSGFSQETDISMPTLWVAMLLAISTGSGSSDRLPYRLMRIRHGELQIVRLYNRHNGRLVWQRTFLFVWLQRPFMGWSPDHRALAFLVKDHHNEYRLHSEGYKLVTPDTHRIFVWRAGERPQLIAHQAVLQTYDGEFDFQWSPDNRRLAFRAEGSGNLDAGVGTICCLNLATGQIREGPSVRRMRWVGRHRIRYWPVCAVRVGPQNVDLVTARHSHLWSCP